MGITEPIGKHKLAPRLTPWLAVTLDSQPPELSSDWHRQQRKVQRLLLMIVTVFIYYCLLSIAALTGGGLLGNETIGASLIIAVLVIVTGPNIINRYSDRRKLRRYHDKYYPGSLLESWERRQHRHLSGQPGAAVHVGKKGTTNWLQLVEYRYQDDELQAQLVRETPLSGDLIADSELAESWNRAAADLELNLLACAAEEHQSQKQQALAQAAQAEETQIKAIEQHGSAQALRSSLLS
jgi:hypothetical protein